MPGALNEVLSQNRERGFLAFVRLVGTACFKKHLSVFISLYNYETRYIYSTLLIPPLLQKRNIMFGYSVVADRILSEEERVPSFTALWHHWQRSFWTSQLSSPLPDLYSTLPLPGQNGWLLNSDGSYSTDWEAPEVQDKITQTINFLTKGCKCKKGCKPQRKQQATVDLAVSAMDVLTYRSLRMLQVSRTPVTMLMAQVVTAQQTQMDQKN